jgi:branched-chain amino acid transport system permease protein
LANGNQVMSDRTARISNERIWLGKLLRLFSILIVITGLAILPRHVNNYVLFVCNTIIVYSLVSVAFNVVIGYLGQLALANAAFFGIGAYATGLLMVHLAAPFVLALVLGALAAAAAGILMSILAMRLSGFYLIAVTWAFTELMRWVYIHADAYTFGALGFNIPSVTLLGYEMDTEERKYYFLLSLALAGIWATARILASRFGRAFVAIKNNEMAAAMAGIAVVRMKFIAFAWSGLIAGLAGGLYALINGRVTPDPFGLDQMLLHFVIVIVGGLGSLIGSVLGAVLLTSFPELLRNAPGLEDIIFSLLLISVLFFIPKGLAGLVTTYMPWLREPLYRRTS